MFSLVYEDFVDREDQLGTLHQAVRKSERSVILVEGRRGIGKTSLLVEFDAELRPTGASVAYIDLAQRLREQGYLSVVEQAQRSLGRKNFARLAQAIQEASLPWQTVRGQVVVRQPEVASGEPAASPRSGGIDFQGDVIAPGAQFAGRDIHNYLLSGDPYEQEWVQDKITTAFIESLEALCEQKCLVLLVDHWESANDETRRWLHDELLQWCLRNANLQVVMVFACEYQPDWYQKRQEIRPVMVAELPEKAIRTYWVEKKHLHEELLAGNLSLYGYPPLLVLFASELVRRNGPGGKSAP